MVQVWVKDLKRPLKLFLVYLKDILIIIKTCKGFETLVGANILFSKMPHILFSFFFPVPIE